jgi:hypothetical protein
MSLEIHNVYFLTTDGWTKSKAEKWLRSHDYKVKKKDPHYVGTELRFNQLSKTKFNPKSYITKILPNGVHLVLAVRK